MSSEEQTIKLIITMIVLGYASADQKLQEIADSCIRKQDERQKA